MLRRILNIELKIRKIIELTIITFFFSGRNTGAKGERNTFLHSFTGTGMNERIKIIRARSASFFRVESSSSDM